MTSGAPRPAEGGGERSVEELQEQIAYLKAFGQACRVQLRSYLEALITDVETEWGRADPAVVPPEVLRPPAQRALPEGNAASSTTFVANTASEAPPGDAADGAVPATAGAKRRN
jgi:hypothetical protein